MSGWDGIGSLNAPILRAPTVLITLTLIVCTRAVYVEITLRIAAAAIGNANANSARVSTGKWLMSAPSKSKPKVLFIILNRCKCYSITLNL